MRELNRNMASNWQQSPTIAPETTPGKESLRGKYEKDKRTQLKRVRVVDAKQRLHSGRWRAVGSEKRDETKQQIDGHAKIARLLSLRHGNIKYNFVPFHGFAESFQNDISLDAAIAIFHGTRPSYTSHI